MSAYVFQSFSPSDAYLRLVSPTDEPIVFSCHVDAVLKCSGISIEAQNRIKSVSYVRNLNFMGRENALKALKLVYIEQKDLPIEYLFSKTSVFSPSFYVLTYKEDSKWSFAKQDTFHCSAIFKSRAMGYNVINRESVSKVICDNEFPMQILDKAFDFFDLDKDGKLDEIEFIGIMSFLKNVKKYNFICPSFLPTNFLRLVRVNPYTLPRRFTSEYYPLIEFTEMDQKFCLDEASFYLYASNFDSLRAYLRRVQDYKGITLRALRFIYQNIPIPESIFKNVWYDQV